jgi:hypothetical protein
MKNRSQETPKVLMKRSFQAIKSYEEKPKKELH